MRPLAVAAALLSGALAFTIPRAGAGITGPVVHIADFKFVPATLPIKAGTTVTFINDDSDAHTVTSATKAFDSSGLDAHDSWSHTFSTPGTFDYLCAVHPYMKGVITVIKP